LGDKKSQKREQRSTSRRSGTRSAAGTRADLNAALTAEGENAADPNRNLDGGDEDRSRGQPETSRVATSAGVEDSAQNRSEKEKAFTPDVLESTIIAVPLLDEFEQEGGLQRIYDVIIDINLEYSGGRDLARQLVRELIRNIIREHRVNPRQQGIFQSKTDLSEQYIFARLRADLIQELVRRDKAAAASSTYLGGRQQAIYHVWPDFEIERLTVKSVSTVKADAARNSFAAYGNDVVWAVLDSGIDVDHPHFRRHRNLELGSSLLHRDFTVIGGPEPDEPATLPEDP